MKVRDFDGNLRELARYLRFHGMGSLQDSRS